MNRVVLAFTLSFVLAPACDGRPTSHQFLAMRYDPPSDTSAIGCLEESAALDAVPGDSAPLTCPATCLVAGAPGGGKAIYVATMCGALPDAITDATGTDPACAGALAAWQAYVADPANCQCGGSCPAFGGDAGADAQADDDANDSTDGASGG